MVATVNNTYQLKTEFTNLVDMANNTATELNMAHTVLDSATNQLITLNRKVGDLETKVRTLESAVDYFDELLPGFKAALTAKLGLHYHTEPNETP